MGRLSIPSIGPRGVVSLRFRCMEEHDCKEAGHPKYLGLPNADTRIFNPRALHEADEVVCITEGELDAVVLEQMGFNAVAITGASAWKAHYHILFRGFSEVLVFEDGDKAGREFSRKVQTEVPSARVVNMGEGMDVNSLYLKEGEDGVRARISGA